VHGYLEARDSASLSRGACVKHFQVEAKLTLRAYRALLKDPIVMLCDEPTSAVDAFTESEIMESLRHLS
jgi:ABC-type multidrug transport system ATPase subunit